MLSFGSWPSAIEVTTVMHLTKLTQKCAYLSEKDETGINENLKPLHVSGRVKMIAYESRGEWMNHVCLRLPVLPQNFQICWSQQNLPVSLLFPGRLQLSLVRHYSLFCVWVCSVRSLLALHCHSSENTELFLKPCIWRMEYLSYFLTKLAVILPVWSKPYSRTWLEKLDDGDGGVPIK